MVVICWLCVSLRVKRVFCQKLELEGAECNSPKDGACIGFKRETPSLSPLLLPRETYNPKTLPAVSRSSGNLLISDLSHLLSGDPAVFLQSSSVCCHVVYLRQSSSLSGTVFPATSRLRQPLFLFSRYAALLHSFVLDAQD